MLRAAQPALAPLPDSRPPPGEDVLRQKLGIPQRAQRVLIFAETSHWDPNWLRTSEEYYQSRIRHILDQVLEELSAEPRRIFSLESLFFVKLYWERQPRQRPLLRRLVRSGQLRLSGSGITTPDTLLPDTEAIIRDYLYGQEWLRAQGLEAEPRLAYLPDGFGHSPLLPSLLRALGYEQVGVSRIDGMYFVGCDYRRRSCYPLPGSSAEQLERDLRSLDFRWQAPDGSEVLCHWNAFTYFQGDMLGHLGVVRWMGRVLGVPWRNAGHVARQIRNFAAKLTPVSPTPYLLCPIGCDFNGPISSLLELLDRYNEQQFDKTGLWTVCAGMDDYLDLVAHHRDRLPAITLDPNPYWMGFYASRPKVKRTSNRLVGKLKAAEALSAAEHISHHPHGGGAAGARQHLRAAWDLLVVSNHHDFITGTSPDRVWYGEQEPLLELCESRADAALAGLAANGRQLLPENHPAGDLEWRLESGLLEARSSHYEVVLSEEAGGCLISCRPHGGAELLAAPANDAVSYFDSGGLWRMGHEFRGGTFRVRAQASRGRARISAREWRGLLEVKIESELEGRPLLRELWLDGDSPQLRMRLTGSVRPRRTLCCRFPTRLRSKLLSMDVPGGVVERSARKLYNPTYWPARSFAHLVDEASPRGLAAFMGGPACVSLQGEGLLELVALRHARWERAFGCLPLPAHPASGSDGERQSFDYAIYFTASGGYRENQLCRRAVRALRAPGETGLALEEVPGSVVQVDAAEAWVTALKRASRGAGVIVRLQRLGPDPVLAHLRCPARAIRSAHRCDARERDLEPLAVSAGVVRLLLQEPITTVRLLYSDSV